MIANIYWIVDKITAYKKTETPLCYSRSFCFFVIKNKCGGTFVIGKKCKYAADIVVLKKHGYYMIAGIFSAFFLHNILSKLQNRSGQKYYIYHSCSYELAHVEMISAILYQLTKDLSMDEIKASGFDTYFVDHTTGIYPVAASGAPFTAAYFQSKGDILTDLTENMAAEQKARTTYDNILRLADDPDVRDPIRFLREREIVHFQRFGEALRITQDNLDSKNFYACNPSFDKNCGRRK